MPIEYENFLQQSNMDMDMDMDVDDRPINPISAEWIGDDTDDEASQLTDDENDTDDNNNNPRVARARFFGSVSDISDFSLSDTEDEDDENEIHETDHECHACGNMFGRRWPTMPSNNMFVCRECLTGDINNINDTNVRTWLSGLGPNGVQDIILTDNAEELTNSAILNPDLDSNFERNHQGVEYLAVETVFELVTHGGFLPRREFNHFLDIVAYVCRRPEPDTGHHRGLTDAEKTLYSSARSSQSQVYSPGEAPLIELRIPRDNLAWSYPSDNNQDNPVEEVHNHYLMSDYPAIVAACGIFMANNFTLIHYN